MAIDSPTTRFTGLQFNPDESSRYNGFFVPQLTPEEIDSIPVDNSKVGGIIYNLHTQELQYLAPTLQWVNITTDGSDGVFDDLTVNGTSTLHTTTATGLTATTLDVSGASALHATTATTLAATTLTAASVNATSNFTIGSNPLFPIATVYNNVYYGARAGGAVFSTNTPSFAVTANTYTKIPATTTTAYSNGFATTDNSITFTAAGPAVTFMTVSIYCSFTYQFSVNNAEVRIAPAISGQPLNPTAFQTYKAGDTYTLSLNSFLSINPPDYIELWVMASANGTFSAAGTMILNVTQI